MNRAMINADEGDSDFEEDDPSKQYIYMELESTQGALADMDVDAMFNSNSVDEFMQFYQQMEASNPNCMKTIDQCHQLAFTFENNYEPGIRFTNKTTSEKQNWYSNPLSLVFTLSKPI